MRITGSGNAAAQQAAREVDPRRTQVTPAEIRTALARAHVKVTGRPATGATLDVLTAQASLETASGGRMYNYNFGGIKGSGPSGETAKLRTHEVIEGKEIEIKDGFRAYRSLDDGAVDYVRLMKERFPAALAQAEKGDTDGFAHALKKSGYYTASEKDYAQGLRLLMGASGASGASSHETGAAATVPALPNFSSMLGLGGSGSGTADGFADGPQLNRMMDAIGHAGAHHEIEDDSDDD